MACIGAVGAEQRWIGIAHTTGVEYRRTSGLIIEKTFDEYPYNISNPSSSPTFTQHIYLTISAYILKEKAIEHPSKITSNIRASPLYTCLNSISTSRRRHEVDRRLVVQLTQSC